MGYPPLDAEQVDGWRLVSDSFELYHRSGSATSSRKPAARAADGDLDVGRSWARRGRRRGGLSELRHERMRWLFTPTPGQAAPRQARRPRAVDWPRFAVPQRLPV